MGLLNRISLRFRLILVISCTALLIWIVSTAVAWFQVRKEVNDVFDAQQILFAQRLASSNLHTILIDRRPQGNEHRRSAFRKPQFDDDALAFAVFKANGERVLSDGRNGEDFPFAPKKGFSRAHLTQGGDEWRIFWLPAAEGKLLIAVGQEMDYRNDLVEDMVLSQMWIWLASLPLLLGLIIWSINRELKPLKRVGEQVQQRTPEDTNPLSENVPTEILPLIQSLNHFFARTSTMLLRERRFTSDAAHELRSPLAALKIQTELAQLAGEDSAMRDNALQNLTQGINRATQLIEQLLTLSRLDNLKSLKGLEEIEWEKLIPSLISELYFPAQKRQIELQFHPLAVPTHQKGQQLLLSLMLRNLIDNAIRYCAEGSTVSITLDKHSITVEDNGGGVDEQDLAKLGQRFYRPAGQNEKGSGLGLSIVQRIAELHHYRITLANSVNTRQQKGLKVRIFW